MSVFLLKPHLQATLFKKHMMLKTYKSHHEIFTLEWMFLVEIGKATTIRLQKRGLLTR